MAKLWDSITGARLVIASDDHCPLHVHARHKAEGWVVRLWFSFESNSAGVMSIAPTANTVRQRQLNQMLDEIVTCRDACRKIWWEGKKTTCLENRWVMRVSPEKMDARRPAPGCKASSIRAIRCEGPDDHPDLPGRDRRHHRERRRGMTEHDITDTEYATAQEAGRRAAESEFRARAVSYLPHLDALEVLTTGSGGFVIPRHLIGALRDVSPADLSKIEVWPDGSLIEIEELDIHISVDGIVRAALPVLIPSRIVAGLFAAAGGAAKSAAKAKSSRQNGKKGGRPKMKVAAA
jgi:hypothetical protein